MDHDGNRYLYEAHRRYNKPTPSSKNNHWPLVLFIIAMALGTCVLVGKLLAGGFASIINALGGLAP